MVGPLIRGSAFEGIFAGQQLGRGLALGVGQVGGSGAEEALMDGSVAFASIWRSLTLAKPGFGSSCVNRRAEVLAHSLAEKLPEGDYRHLVITLPKKMGA